MNGLVVIGASAAILAFVSAIFSTRNMHGVEGYVLARNALDARAMTMTLFATAMGVWILFGPAEALLTSGIAALTAYALSSAFSLWAFAILGKRIRALIPEGKSLIEFVLQRFGRATYLLVLAVTFLYMAIALTAALSGIGLAGGIIFGLPAWQTSLIVGAATVAYTALGGFRASVTAGKIQTFVILPLLALIVILSALTAGDFGAAWSAANIPPLGWPDIEYGLALVIGVIAAEAFNQIWWQHVYSGKDERAMRRGFFYAGAMVIPVVACAGLLGVYAASSGAGGNPSVAVFDFLATMPSWVSASAMVLAVSLVMGNMDSLLNGMVAIAAIDVKRLHPKVADGTLLVVAKVLTLVFAAAAMVVATAGYSVLYLFLIADLICAGAAFPIFFGMFSDFVGKRTAFWAALSGIAAGLFLFPDPSFSHGNLFQSFCAALLVPAVVIFLVRITRR